MCNSNVIVLPLLQLVSNVQLFLKERERIFSAVIDAVLVKYKMKLLVQFSPLTKWVVGGGGGYAG